MKNNTKSDSSLPAGTLAAAGCGGRALQSQAISHQTHPWQSKSWQRTGYLPRTPSTQACSADARSDSTASAHSQHHIDISAHNSTPGTHHLRAAKIVLQPQIKRTSLLRTKRRGPAYYRKVHALHSLQFPSDTPQTIGQGDKDEERRIVSASVVTSASLGL